MQVCCPICHDSSKTTLEESRLNLYRCASCLHTFTVIPREEQEVYDSDYFLKTHKNWFDNPNYRLFDSIYARLLKLLGNERFRLLDVGCGKGDFLKYIAAKSSITELFGIDLTYNRHPRIRFIQGDFLQERIETEFDAICSFVVIEHIDNPTLFAQKLNACLRPGGVLLIVTNNSNSLLYRIARLLNKVGIHIAHDRLYSAHHLQHYTNQSLRELMAMNGFRLLSQENHNCPMKAVDVPESNPLVERICKLMVWAIFLLSMPFGCGQFQTVVCRRENL